MPRMPMMVAAVVAALLVLPGAALASSVEVPGGQVSLLAVDDEPAGPDPAPRDAPENPARDLGGYEDRETPFTWGAAWLLSALGFGGLAVLLAVYRFRVRPGDRDRTAA